MLKEHVPLLLKKLNTGPFSHSDILSSKSPNFFSKRKVTLIPALGKQREVGRSPSLRTA